MVVIQGTKYELYVKGLFMNQFIRYRLQILLVDEEMILIKALLFIKQFFFSKKKAYVELFFLLKMEHKESYLYDKFQIIMF